MGRREWNNLTLSDADVNAIRSFLRQALRPYVYDMRDFYLSLDTIDMSTGEHPWALREHADGALGYMVVREGPKDFRSTTVFPFVRPSKLDIGIPGGTKPQVLQEIMDEPVDVAEFLVYYKRGKLCFLTRELAQADLDRVKMQDRIFLTREEAFALLNGETLEITKEKVRRAFGIRRKL